MEDVVMTFAFLIAVSAVSARLALRPIADAIVRIGQAFPGPGVTPPSNARVAELERQVAELSEQVHRLEQVEHFHRELASGSPVSTPPTSAT